MPIQALLPEGFPFHQFNITTKHKQRHKDKNQFRSFTHIYLHVMDEYTLLKFPDIKNTKATYIISVINITAIKEWAPYAY